LIDTELAAVLHRFDDGQVPLRLRGAMNYAALAGGKRIRPFLLLESAALFDVPPAVALPAALALECIHTYSLVHDDLPDMDNDDMRRGQPTVHKEFDPATAILVGDALLTIAFEVLSEPSADLDPKIQLALIAQLSKAAGYGGMIGGQLYDLTAEGRFDTAVPAQDEQAVLRTQRMKTGALLSFACQAGATLGNADDSARQGLGTYGAAVGLAFQIQDDVLDRTAHADTLGKAAGKDVAAGKATFVDLYGLEGARSYASQLVQEAQTALEPFGQQGEMLRQLAQFITDRES
jgi:farnesyl diphosphate synthase